MKLGVYVGSFDPFHKGHQKVIEHLIDLNYVDKVIVIPSGNYWDKQNLTEIKKRVDMISLYHNDKIIIDRKLGNNEFTYQIMTELKKIYPNDELNLIIGADNLPKFHLWENINKILENKIIVIPRNNINPQDYINRFQEKEQFIIVDSFNEDDISSTMIRSLIKTKDYESLNKYLCKDVITYIKDNNLYGG